MAASSRSPPGTRSTYPILWHSWSVRVRFCASSRRAARSHCSSPAATVPGMAAPPPLYPGWTAHATAAGAAAVTGAAQVGLGYGLGVMEWPAGPTTDDSAWLGSLGWATWIAASATVFGAVLAARLPYRPGGPWRVTLAASAAVGALLPLALIALPARTAVRS